MFKRINIERTEMIALSTHSGDGSSPAVPMIGAMEAIAPQAMAICRIRFDVTSTLCISFPGVIQLGEDCRPIREDRMVVGPTASLSVRGITRTRKRII